MYTNNFDDVQSVSCCQSVCLLPSWWESKLLSARWTTPLNQFFLVGTNLLDNFFWARDSCFEQQSPFIVCFSACNSAATLPFVLVSRMCHRMVGYVVRYIALPSWASFFSSSLTHHHPFSPFGHIIFLVLPSLKSQCLHWHPALVPPLLQQLAPAGWREQGKCCVFHQPRLGRATWAFQS